MASKPSITIIGPGRLGKSLAENLVKAGYPVREIVFPTAKSLQKGVRGLPRILQARATTWIEAHFDTDIVWLCVPDGQIQPVASRLKSVTDWKNKVVFHSSGVLTSDVLRDLGASVASVHPLMTFVHGSQPSLKDVPFALEGDSAALRVARQIVKNLGAEAFSVKKEDKAMYHAWGTFLSPLLLAFMVTAEQAATATGISAKEARKKMLPIAKQTLSNYVTIGPSQSFSGPLVRGDVATVREHLNALKRIPEARETYIALARSALRHLPVRNRTKLKKLLAKV
jgi:predicted short-subunit dehydrogenase-like oxidoreductase (DUF2520 family)